MKKVRAEAPFSVSRHQSVASAGMLVDVVIRPFRLPEVSIFSASWGLVHSPYQANGRGHNLSHAVPSALWRRSVIGRTRQGKADKNARPRWHPAKLATAWWSGTCHEEVSLASCLPLIPGSFGPGGLVRQKIARLLGEQSTATSKRRCCPPAEEGRSRQLPTGPGLQDAHWAPVWTCGMKSSSLHTLHSLIGVCASGSRPRCSPRKRTEHGALHVVDTGKEHVCHLVSRSHFTRRAEIWVVE
ncbi:hypothetical protein VTI74DRAFT_2664 [Chaetomium olivicolor]